MTFFQDEEEHKANNYLTFLRRAERHFFKLFYEKDTDAALLYQLDYINSSIGTIEYTLFSESVKHPEDHFDECHRESFLRWMSFDPPTVDTKDLNSINIIAKDVQSRFEGIHYDSQLQYNNNLDTLIKGNFSLDGMLSGSLSGELRGKND